MLIDWFTVGAQALNFIILVWLMKRFLYKPILDAIDAREKRIAAALADAEAKKAEAHKEQDEFQHKSEEFDRQRAALLSQATAEVNAERQRLLDEARQAADALTAKRQETLRGDAQRLDQAISRRTQQEVFAIARKALADLATTSLEERFADVFVRRLRAMDGQAKESLGKALKTATDLAIVRSAFDLPAQQRAAIQTAVNENFSADIILRFETAPDLVGGIELSAHGQKVAWSISDYLASLEEGVSELLKEQPKPHAKPETKAAPKSEVKSESTTGARAAPRPEASPDLGLEAKTEPTLEADVQAGPKPGAQIAPKPEAEPKSGPKPEFQVKASPAPGAAPEATASAEPEVKTEAKPETKVEPRAKEPKIAPTTS